MKPTFDVDLEFLSLLLLLFGASLCCALHPSSPTSPLFYLSSSLWAIRALEELHFLYSTLKEEPDA